MACFSHSQHKDIFCASAAGSASIKYWICYPARLQYKCHRIEFHTCFRTGKHQVIVNKRRRKKAIPVKETADKMIDTCEQVSLDLIYWYWWLSTYLVQNFVRCQVTDKKAQQWGRPRPADYVDYVRMVGFSPCLFGIYSCMQSHFKPSIVERTRPPPKDKLCLRMQWMLVVGPHDKLYAGSLSIVHVAITGLLCVVHGVKHLCFCVKHLCFSLKSQITPMIFVCIGHRHPTLYLVCNAYERSHMNFRCCARFTIGCDHHSLSPFFVCVWSVQNIARPGLHFAFKIRFVLLLHSYWLVTSSSFDHHVQENTSSAFLELWVASSWYCWYTFWP